MFQLINMPTGTVLLMFQPQMFSGGELAVAPVSFFLSPDSILLPFNTLYFAPGQFSTFYPLVDSSLLHNLSV